MRKDGWARRDRSSAKPFRRLSRGRAFYPRRPFIVYLFCVFTVRVARAPEELTELALAPHELSLGKLRRATPTAEVGWRHATHISNQQIQPCCAATSRFSEDPPAADRGDVSPCAAPPQQVYSERASHYCTPLTIHAQCPGKSCQSATKLPRCQPANVAFTGVRLYRAIRLRDACAWSRARATILFEYTFTLYE